jgi:hypothetical protein
MVRFEGEIFLKYFAKYSYLQLAVLRDVIILDVIALLLVDLYVCFELLSRRRGQR